ncbi:MAG: hypothetical protein KDA37_18935 [Planctomycetales bacterium]|nr:hypothetical protein [Planctomycetales bacterium]
MVAATAVRTDISQSAPVPHGPVHVAGEIATLAVASLFHGTVLVTSKLARAVGLRLP